MADSMVSQLRSFIFCCDLFHLRAVTAPALSRPGAWRPPGCGRLLRKKETGGVFILEREGAIGVDSDDDRIGAPFSSFWVCALKDLQNFHDVETG